MAVDIEIQIDEQYGPEGLTTGGGGASMSRSSAICWKYLNVPWVVLELQSNNVFDRLRSQTPFVATNKFEGPCEAEDLTSKTKKISRTRREDVTRWTSFDILSIYTLDFGYTLYTTESVYLHVN